MEYKQAPPELEGFVERAQSFWEQIDVDGMQPVIYQDEETDEEKAKRAEMMRLIEEKQKAYEDYQAKLALEGSESETV